MKSFKSKIFLILFLIILVAGIICGVFCQKILRKTGEYLIYEQPLEKCDAVMILAGDTYSRTIEAADIYNEGYARYIIAPMETEDPIFSEIRKRKLDIRNPKEEVEFVLVSMGIPKQALIYPDKPTDRTIEEANAALKILKSHPEIRCLITVTSRYHSLRASKIFKKTLRSSDVKLISRTARFDGFDPKDWWHKPGYVRNTVNEYIKLLTMIFY